MKRHKLFYVSALSMMLACSSACNDGMVEHGTVAPETTVKSDTKILQLSSMEMAVLKTMSGNSPKISQDEAMSIAEKFLGQSSLSKSAGNVHCDVITRKKPSISKSGTDESDTLMYVLNYGNNNGYALICADVRVPDQILAFGETGSMDTETDNPGVKLFLDMAEDYMDANIAEIENKRDSLEEIVLEKLGVNNENTLNTQSVSKSKIEKFRCTTIKSSITVEDAGRVDPLIKTEWHQSSPFNEKCGGSDAGCVPIAVSQILNYWRFRNIDVDWNIIENGNNKEFAAEVSKLIKILRKELDTKGTSTHEHKALKYFNRINCSTQSQMHDYEYSKMTNALNKRLPVYIRGNRESSGHAWIADGYLKRYVTKTETVKYMFIETQDNGTITKCWYEDIEDEWPTSYRMLHFNWGWGRNNGNGYYNNNIFDTNKEMVANKNGDGYFHYEVSNTEERHYYNKNIEIITDIKPRY